MRDEYDGRCPGCRSKYEERKFRVAQEPHTEGRRNGSTTLAADPTADDPRCLRDVRVIQRKVVKVTGLPPRIAHGHILRRHGYLGQYGEIRRIIVSRPTREQLRKGPAGMGASAYVTFGIAEDAAHMVRAVDGFNLDGRTLCCSFGTTKYCRMFLKSERCNNSRCLCMHELGHDASSVTKAYILKLAFPAGEDVANDGPAVTEGCQPAFPPRGCSAKRWMDAHTKAKTSAPEAPQERPPPRTSIHSRSVGRPSSGNHPPAALFGDRHEQPQGMGPLVVPSPMPALCSDLEQIQQLAQLEQYGLGGHGKYSDIRICSMADSINEPNAASEGGLGELLKSINGSAPLLPYSADRTTTASRAQEALCRGATEGRHHSAVYWGKDQSLPNSGGFGDALSFTPQFHTHGSTSSAVLPGHGSIGGLNGSRQGNPKSRDMCVKPGQQPPNKFLRSQQRDIGNGRRIMLQQTAGNSRKLPVAAKIAAERAARAAEAVANVVGLSGK